MSTRTDSFDGSRMGAFRESRADARDHTCACIPGVLASFVTNGIYSTRRCWDLRPYQGPGVSNSCGGFWRLIEIGCCYPNYISDRDWYGRGCVSSTGELLRLPSEFCTPQLYDGYMELQIGCPYPGPPAGLIEWPESSYEAHSGDHCGLEDPCQIFTPIFECGAAIASPFVDPPFAK